ncbi:MULTISPECIES: hypothetical protein [Methylococcus]|uniref:Secreted protein n=1 Tax=Methylococcus capsulatus TaxID=414 RepID=A0ABZ2F6Y3_METCP|nr:MULTISPECIES: hypothetical protein [Methylococcus]MDF9392527.1 hypothetical protein [Methylococcus capsulatus]
MIRTKFLKCGLLAAVLGLGALIPATLWAHGGGSGVDVDSCRIPVGGFWVHFTAYQPQLTGTTEYCDKIPETGPTTLVFDYEGKALRNMTVEFEITKEPEGSRVFYQAPATYPTGTVNATINFTEPSDYLAHVTLVNEGQKIDAHIPFKVGVNQTSLSGTTWIIIMVIVVALSYILYLSNAGFKKVVDSLLLIKKKT